MLVRSSLLLRWDRAVGLIYFPPQLNPFVSCFEDSGELLVMEVCRQPVVMWTPKVPMTLSEDLTAAR